MVDRLANLALVAVEMASRASNAALTVVSRADSDIGTILEPIVSFGVMVPACVGEIRASIAAGNR